MASEKLSYDQIAEKNLFEPLKKEIREVDKMLSDMSKNLKGIIEDSKKLANTNPLESYENMKDAEKAIEDTGKAVEQLDKIERERKKLQQQLIDLEDERIKKNFELREEINRQKKELRDQAKAAADSGDAYRVLTKRTNDAQKEFKRLAAEFGATSKQAKEARKAFEEADKKLRKVNEAAKDGRRDVGRYEAALQGVNNRLDKFGKTISGGIIIQALTGLVQLFQQNESGADGFSKVLGTVSATLTIFTQNLVKTFQESTNIFNLFTNLGKNFENFDDQVSNAAKSISNAVEVERELSRQTVKVTNELAELVKVQADQELAADDVSKSLTSQLEATKILIDTTDEILKKEQQLAKLRIQAAQERLNATPKSIAAQQALADAVKEAADIEAAAILELNGLRRQAAGFELDIAEQNLDILLDVSDRRKTIAEQIAADETENFSVRQNVIDQAEKDLASSLEAQLKEVQKFTDKRIDLDRLLAIENTEKLNEEIKRLDLNERAQNRLREVIVERLQAVQDLSVAQQELTKAETEAKLLNEENAILQEAYNKSILEEADLQLILTSLEEERLKKSVANAQFRFDQAKSNSEENFQLENDLLEAKFELLQFYNKKEIEEEKRKQEQIQELTEAGFEVLQALNQKRAEDRIENIDSQLEAARDRESELRDLAERGSADAEESLGRLQQRQAELALQREQEVQRQQRFELALAAIQTYTAKVQAGDPPGQAIASTLTDISLLQSLVQALPSFFEGTEDTGKALQALDAEGGRLAVLHDNERVMTKRQNQLIPKGMSNMELALLAHQSQFINDRKSSVNRDAEIVQGLREVKQAIKDKKEYLGTNYNQQKGLITDIYKKNQRLIREHHKIGRAFS